MPKHTHLKPLPTAVNDDLARTLTQKLLATFDALRPALEAHELDCIDLLPLEDALEELSLRLNDLSDSDPRLFDVHWRARVAGP